MPRLRPRGVRHTVAMTATATAPRRPAAVGLATLIALLLWVSAARRRVALCAMTSVPRRLKRGYAAARQPWLRPEARAGNVRGCQGRARVRPRPDRGSRRSRPAPISWPRAQHGVAHVLARVRLGEEVPAGPDGVDHVQRQLLLVHGDVEEGVASAVIEVVVEDQVLGREEHRTLVRPMPVQSSQPSRRHTASAAGSGLDAGQPRARAGDVDAAERPQLRGQAQAVQQFGGEEAGSARRAESSWRRAVRGSA